jgi:hypothetical protein
MRKLSCADDMSNSRKREQMGRRESERECGRLMERELSRKNKGIVMHI